VSNHDDRLRVCLKRVLELDAARLSLRDWPGFGGPLVHVPDPLSPADGVVEALAGELAPKYRVLSLSPRPRQPYQVAAADLLGLLDQFGFLKPVLVGERLGCVPALLIAAWHPERVAGLVLVDPTYDAPASDTTSIEAHALRDCPADWPALRSFVQCRVLAVAWHRETPRAIADFVQA
jgi:pimeloyl-ACP methyl ester carboxylesterase